MPANTDANNNTDGNGVSALASTQLSTAYRLKSDAVSREPRQTPETQSVSQIRSAIQERPTDLNQLPYVPPAEGGGASTYNSVAVGWESNSVYEKDSVAERDSGSPAGKGKVGRRRGRGCLAVIPRLGCRTLGCIGCFLPLLLLFVAAMFLLIRPVELWEPFKETLNQNVSLTSASEIPQDPDTQANATLLAELFDQALAVAAADQSDPQSPARFTLKQSQLAEIFASRIELARGMHLELGDGELILYRNLEPQGEPLWLIADFRLEDDKFTLSKLKISSVELPEFVRDAARDGLQSGFSFVNLQDPADLFGKLVQVGQEPRDVAAIKLTSGAVIIELK